MPSNKLPELRPGQRAMVAGRTGMGKSTLGCWLLSRSNSHWLILNPKHTKSYQGLEDQNTITSFDKKRVSQSLEKHRFTIFNPENIESGVEYLDLIVEWLSETYDNVGLCCDELYTMHKGNAQAGSGLIGWLTRGREKKQSFLGLTQRPRWISQFIFSESDYIGSLDLTLNDDRKRMSELTGHDIFMERQEPYKWLWYDVAKDHIRKFGPVPVAPKTENGK